MQQHWNPERLQFLVTNAGLTMKKTAAILGVSTSLISQWINNRSVPSIDLLVRLADLFGVSLDYLCGRCTEEESHEIQKDFKRYFKDRNNETYMRYLAMPDKRNIIPPGVEAPWPYNLLEDVFGDPWEEMLSDLQQDGLSYALESLTERERDMVHLYYEGELSLGDIGEQYSLTTERVRQVVHKAVRKLRHPARQKAIRFGYDKAAHEKEIEDRKRRLDDYLQQLDQKEADLKAREAFLEERSKRIAKSAEALGVADIIDNVIEYSDTSIEDLQLSVRAYNVLLRGRIRTISDIIKNAGRLSELRNMGKATLQEIVQKVYDYAGIRIDTNPRQ